MKLSLVSNVRFGISGIIALLWPAVAHPLDRATATAQLGVELSGQMGGYDTAMSEALLLVVFIFLLLAVVAHKSKTP
jgi:hypothetical protein